MEPKLKRRRYLRFEGNEHSVSICAKDNAAPYDYELTNRLIECAKATDTKYAVDVFYRYGTDANAAIWYIN